MLAVLVFDSVPFVCDESPLQPELFFAAAFVIPELVVGKGAVYVSFFSDFDHGPHEVLASEVHPFSLRCWESSNSELEFFGVPDHLGREELWHALELCDALQETVSALGVSFAFIVDVLESLVLLALAKPTGSFAYQQMSFF